MSTIPEDQGMGAVQPETTEATVSSTSTTERLAEKAHKGIDGAAATVAEAERELRRAATEAADRARRSEEQLAEALEQNLARLRTYIERNPIQSAGIAFAAGIALSVLLRR